MTIGDLQENLAQTVRNLRKASSEIEKKLKKLPDGTLEVWNGSNGRTKYIQRLDGRRIYVNSSDEDFLKQLQEKQYYSKYLILAEKELESLEKIKRILDKTPDAETAFFDIPQGKRFLIEPFVCTDENLKKELKDTPCNDVNKDSSFMTKDGVGVKSKSELIIANKLVDAGVPYIYEPYLLMHEGMAEYWHPDFYVLNKRTGKLYYWEHFGMMDNKDYLDGFHYKLERYADIGLFPGEGLIITTESSQHPIRTSYIDNVINQYLK